MEIIIGTYEEFLLGYKFELKNEKPSLVQSFADKSHTGSVKCVAVQEHWIASGGTDDRIFIYDMSSRKQSQILLSHEGTLNALAFTPDGTHLLSAGDDGRMIATRLKTWFTEATWQKAHDGSPVTHVSCHPSGKLALSLGGDLVLRTWNLVKGRVAYKTNLKSRNTLGPQPDCLAWSPTGDYFTLTGQRIIEFWCIKKADVFRSQKTKSKPVCLTWIADEICLLGLEDGKLLWLSVKSEEAKEFTAHDARVKAICASKDYLVTASSSGEIKLWKIMLTDQNLKEIAKTNIGCRPTCVSILDLEQFGDNYVISSTLEAKDVDTKPSTSKPKIPQRGIVTIEYDNDDAKNESSEEEDDEPVSESNTNKDTENEADSVAEEDNGDNENDSDEDIEDDSDEDIEDEDDEDTLEEEEDCEPQIPLPKSRKHKLQIAKRKEDNKKKQKLGSKIPAKNKQKSQKLQKNKSKQKSRE